MHLYLMIGGNCYEIVYTGIRYAPLMRNIEWTYSYLYLLKDGAMQTLFPCGLIWEMSAGPITQSANNKIGCQQQLS
jgi:hypothetical protein